MAYGRRESSPLPYHVIFILLLVFILLGASWYFTYEETVEEVGDNINWILLFSPVLLLLIIRWISSVDSFSELFLWAGWLYPHDQRYNHPGDNSSNGCSPWGVTIVMAIVLALIFFQSF